MNERELTDLLRSPVLSLDPRPDLVPAVRAGARRHRRRRAAASVALSALAVVGVAGVAAGVRGGDDAPPDVASADLADRFPEATSPVQGLAELNGGTVATFFKGRQWCTASFRTGPPNVTCAGAVGPGRVRPFAYLRGAGTESLAVDRDYVVAGILGDGVARVEVELASAGRAAATLTTSSFPRPVWSRPVAAGDRVVFYYAYGVNGVLLERRPG